MTVESVTESFANYGLGERETRLLVTLAKLGPIKASSVAKNLGVNRMAAYRMLSRLTDLGILQVSAEKPMRFAVAPIEEVLEILTRVEKDRLSKMETAKERLVQEWKTLAPQTEGEMENRFRIVQGREQIYNLIKRMCTSSEREILIMTTSNDVVRMRFAGVDDVLEQAYRRGIKIKIICEASSSNLEAVERLMDFSDLKHIALRGAGRLVISDEKEILTSLAFDDSISLKTESDLGLWTDGRQYIMMLRELFHQTAENSITGSEALMAIKSGRPVEEVRVVRGEKEFENARESLIRSAKVSLFIVVANIESLRPLEEVLLSAASLGVKVEIISSINEKNMKYTANLLKAGEVRHTVSIKKIDLVVADGSQFLLSLEKAGGREAVWSNIPQEVETLSKLFETPWSLSIPAAEKIAEIETSASSREIVLAVTKSLRRAGWEVSSPGIARANSGIENEFDVIAFPEGQESEMVVIDILMANSDGYQEKLMKTLLKVAASQVGRAFVVAVPSLGETIAHLPDLYGVRVIQGSTPDAVSRALLGMMNPSHELPALRKSVH